MASATNLLRAAALLASLLGVLAGTSTPSGAFLRELTPTEISS